MSRSVPGVGFLVALLLPPALTAQDVPNRSQVQFDDSGTGSCTSDHWCLDLQVLDADSLQPLQAADVTVSACGAFLSDQSGAVHVQCPQAGLVTVRVRQIGFQPASGSAELHLGHRYRVTVHLAVPSFITRDVFGTAALCHTDDSAAERRCLQEALKELAGRLDQVLAAARKSAPTPALLDSAQAAWLRFRTAHCTARADLQKNDVPLPTAQLECQVDLTEARVAELASYWTLKEWKEWWW